MRFEKGGWMSTKQAWVLGLASVGALVLGVALVLASCSGKDVRILGGVFGVAVSVAVFAGVGGYASTEEFSAGFAAAMGTVTALAFIGMLVALGMPGSRPTTITEPTRATSAVPQGESAQP
jgi:hypothetical protein